MKIIMLAMLLMVSVSANAMTAYWTGVQEMGQSVTNQMIWNCQYQYNGQLFWRAFLATSNCPMSIEIY